MGQRSVGQLVEVRHTSGSLVHEVVQRESRADTLRAVELVLAVRGVFSQFSGTAGELNEPKQTMIGLILNPLESRIVRMRMIRSQFVHVANQHVVRNEGVVPIRRVEQLRHGSRGGGRGEGNMRGNIRVLI
jgi:hypothetical protein